MHTRNELFGLAVLTSLSATAVCLFLSEWGGLQLIIALVALVMLLEVVMSFTSLHNDMIGTWAACVFHTLGFFAFWGGMTVCDHPIFTPFSYENGLYYVENPTSSGALWWVLIGLLALRLFIIQPIIYICYEAQKEKEAQEQEK